MVSAINNQDQSSIVQVLQAKTNSVQNNQSTPSTGAQSTVKGSCNPCTNCGACGKAQDPSTVTKAQLTPPIDLKV